MAASDNPFDLLGMDSLTGAAPALAPTPQAAAAPTNNNNVHAMNDPFDFGSGNTMPSGIENANNAGTMVAAAPSASHQHGNVQQHNQQQPMTQQQQQQVPANPHSTPTSGKWPSMLDQQWNTGCNSRQPSRQYMVICAKQCNVPGGIETLMRRGGNSANSAPSSAAHQNSRNEQMIMQMQNNGNGNGGRNAAYPDSSSQMNNPVSGSLSNKARNLAGRFTKAAKGAVDLAERNISSMAIKAAYASNDPSKVVDSLTASVLISQPIHTNYPGSAKFDELSKTEPKKLLSSAEEAHPDDEEVVWALPILLPPALSQGQPEDQGKDRLVQVRIQMKSSAALTSKQYLVGSATFSLKELLGGPQGQVGGHYKAALQSQVLSEPGAAVEVYVLGNRKYPPLGGVGWSLTDPMPDNCGSMNAPYCPPLEQLYALKKVQQNSHGAPPHTSFPQNVCVAIERTQESSVVLPISTAVTRLLAEAAMHSAQHADSVARVIKSNALRFRDPVEALEENRHAECIIDLCHLTRYNGISSPNAQGQAPMAGGGMCQVRIALQAPDCIFERPICASQVPVLLGQGGNAQPGAGGGRIHTTFPFYPKRHVVPVNVQGAPAGQPAQSKVTLGMLRFEVRSDGPNGPGGSPTQHQSISPSQAGIGTNIATVVWEGYADMDPVLDQAKGSFMEVPMFVTSSGGNNGNGGGGASPPGSQMVATLMIKLSARSPPPRHAGGPPSSGQTLISANKGLLNLFNMAPHYNGLLDKSENNINNNATQNRLGDFFAMEWMDDYAKKRHLDAGTLVGRYESYKLALSRPDPQLATLPSFKRKCPSWFRPSSAKGEMLLSGIPFNTHVQALTIEPLVAPQQGQAPPPPAAWHNITCGAAADHPRGFTASNDKPGGAGGVRRLEQKRDELAKLYAESEQKLVQAVKDYVASHNGRRRFVPVDEPYVAHHRAACFRVSQRLAELNWEIAKRRGNLLSQVLGQAVTAYLAAVSDVTRSNDTTARQWLDHGFLVCYEGLLSAAGKETAMIEDAFSAIEMLQHVTVELVDAGAAGQGNTNNLGPKGINIVGSRVIRAMELVRYEGNEAGGTSAPQQPQPEAPLVDLLGGMGMNSAAPAAQTAPAANQRGQGGSLVVRVALDSAYYNHRLPQCLRNGTRVNFYAMLFQMGVDIMQWGANVHATSKMGGPNAQQGGGMNSLNGSQNSLNTSQRSAGTASSTNSSSGALDEDEDAEGGRGDEDNDLLVALNNEAFRKLNKYAFRVKSQVQVDSTAMTIHNGPAIGGGVTVVHPMLNRLWTNICDSANKMEHGVLDSAGEAASTLNGSGVIFCKSGKDRTAMQATLKQSQFLVKSGVRHSDQTAVVQDATLMRMYGTRLSICEKNVGQPKYAFNALQAKFMPEQLKPPLDSVAGFLKGGSIFSRNGAIES